MSFLSKLFNSFIRHKYMPKNLLLGEIRPNLKPNSSSKTSSDNYRPVMNSSNFLKIFEYSILPTCSKYLRVQPQQFGFQPGSNCSSVITILKETIHSYLNDGSMVHAALID